VVQLTVILSKRSLRNKNRALACCLAKLHHSQDPARGGRLRGVTLVLGCPMPSQSEPEPQPNAPQSPAVEHIAGAHRLMKSLQEKIGEHPELAEAIRSLELALNILTVQTGGFL